MQVSGKAALVGARDVTTHVRKVDTRFLHSKKEQLLFIFFPLICNSVIEITNNPKNIERDFSRKI
jgi:hypothetical protein